MIDIYLKANDQEDLVSFLTSAGFVKGEKVEEMYHPEASLSVIGVIQKQKSIDSNTGEILFDVLPGYHANVRTLSECLAKALEDKRNYPETPVRVWF